MEYLYKSEYLHNLTCHKEFTRSYVDASPIHIILRLFSCGALLLLISLFDYPIAIRYFFIFIVAFVVTRLIVNPKKGDIQYKRMLQANNGHPTHQQQFFTQTGVHCINVDSGNQVDFAYDQFRYVIESKNLLILVMQHRTCLIINKASLEGDKLSEFFTFLKANCPKLKGKKPRKTIVGRIVRILIVTIVILGTIWALLNLPDFSLMDKIYGRLDNSMSYTQMADRLSELDIHITDKTIREMEEYDNEYLSSNGEDFYDNSARGQKAADLLYWEGAGIYDEDTSQWYPSQSGIYWQDYEAFNADSIYTEFLTGLAAMDENLTFTDIQESMSKEAIEEGIGTVTVLFQWQGQEYALEAEYFYDWFDTAVIAQLGKIINSGDEQLYVCCTEDYGAMLYYGSAQQIRKLERITGMNFQNASRRIW